MKNNLWLLNKAENSNNITFTVWSDAAIDIITFKKKVVSIKEISKVLEEHHEISKGYWINITIPQNSFEKVVSDIKNIFKDSMEINIRENFARKEWNTHISMEN